MSDQQITYDLEVSLSAPEGGVLTSILVTVEIEPKDASCLIYGWQPDGNMGCIQVNGPGGDLELPFSKPQIYVKYLGGLQNIRVSTRGWKDSARSG